MAGDGFNFGLTEEDSGAGVGTFPPLIPGETRILPPFLSQASLNTEFLTPDAQRNLSSCQEYQSLLESLNLVANGVIARSNQVEYHEGPLPDEEAPTEHCVQVVPSPMRKRVRREGGAFTSSRKRPLEIDPPLVGG